MTMTQFTSYRDSFPNAKLERSDTGVIEITLHTNAGTLVFDGHTHEQFVDLFHAVANDPENRVVIMTGSGDAFMEEIAPDGFDFFTPTGYDKIYREGKKVLMNILDVEVPMIAAINGRFVCTPDTRCCATSRLRHPTPFSRPGRIARLGSWPGDLLSASHPEPRS
jgi:Enoyl-CoA hydratase/isomerase